MIETPRMKAHMIEAPMIETPMMKTPMIETPMTESVGKLISTLPVIVETLEESPRDNVTPHPVCTSVPRTRNTLRIRSVSRTPVASDTIKLPGHWTPRDPQRDDTVRKLPGKTPRKPSGKSPRFPDHAIPFALAQKQPSPLQQRCKAQQTSQAESSLIRRNNLALSLPSICTTAKQNTFVCKPSPGRGCSPAPPTGIHRGPQNEQLRGLLAWVRQARQLAIQLLHDGDYPKDLRRDFSRDWNYGLNYQYDLDRFAGDMLSQNPIMDQFFCSHRELLSRNHVWYDMVKVLTQHFRDDKEFARNIAKRVDILQKGYCDKFPLYCELLSYRSTVRRTSPAFDPFVNCEFNYYHEGITHINNTSFELIRNHIMGADVVDLALVNPGKVLGNLMKVYDSKLRLCPHVEYRYNHGAILEHVLRDPATMIRFVLYQDDFEHVEELVGLFTNLRNTRYYYTPRRDSTPTRGDYYYFNYS